METNIDELIKSFNVYINLLPTDCENDENDEKDFDNWLKTASCTEKYRHILEKYDDEEEVDFAIVGCGDPSAFKIFPKKDEEDDIRDLEDAYDSNKYLYFSNKGICRIKGKTRYNCCIFIVMAKMLKMCKKNLFYSLRKKSKTDIDVIIQLFKSEYPEYLDNIDNKQSDILLDFFSKWSDIRIRLIYMIKNNEEINSWDLYDGDDEPDALIFQYPNHFECAISKVYL